MVMTENGTRLSEQMAYPEFTPPVGITAEAVCRIKVGNRFLLILDRDEMKEGRFILRPVGGRYSILDDPLHWEDDLHFDPSPGRVDTVGTVPSGIIYQFVEDRMTKGERHDDPKKFVRKQLKQLEWLRPADSSYTVHYAGTDVMKSSKLRKPYEASDFQV